MEQIEEEERSIIITDERNDNLPIEVLPCVINVVMSDKAMLSMYGIYDGYDMLDEMYSDALEISSIISKNRFFYDSGECLDIVQKLRYSFEKINNSRVLPLPVKTIIISMNNQNILESFVVKRLKREGSCGISIFITDSAFERMKFNVQVQNTIRLESCNGYIINERPKANIKKNKSMYVYSKICSISFFDDNESTSKFMNFLSKIPKITIFKKNNAVLVIWETFPLRRVLKNWEENDYGIIISREKEMCITTHDDNNFSWYPIRKKTKKFLLSEIVISKVFDEIDNSNLITEGKYIGFYSFNKNTKIDTKEGQ